MAEEIRVFEESGECEGSSARDVFAGIGLSVLSLFAIAFCCLGSVFLLPFVAIFSAGVHRSPPYPAFHQAAADGDIAALQELLDSGTLVTEELPSSFYREEGATALWIAARFDQPEAVSFLLSVGGDPDDATVGLGTPLHVANAATTRLLIASGADVNVRRADDVDKLTPLMCAASDFGRAEDSQTGEIDQPRREDALERVRLLLEAGAHREAKSVGRYRRTAFMIAGRYSQPVPEELRVLFEGEGASDSDHSSEPRKP